MFGHISYWHDNSRAKQLLYLSTMQSPAPASSLAELPPATSPQLGRWICQQELRSARTRGLLPVLAAASAAASTTIAIAFLRLVTFRTGSIYDQIYNTCLGFIRHGIRVTLHVLVRVATAW